ncbi:unnamed protein product [Acanthosepion pharaonis]|uniref:Uncharacterized protein n=1 Tax=Acanthosepion pharaonis TaxID=158019 RepID=A0A812DVY7_ACAPH|nr:unnamed protein product [Sepia pharaonis]
MFVIFISCIYPFSLFIFYPFSLFILLFLPLSHPWPVFLSLVVAARLSFFLACPSLSLSLSPPYHSGHISLTCPNLYVSLSHVIIAHLFFFLFLCLSFLNYSVLPLSSLFSVYPFFYISNIFFFLSLSLHSSFCQKLKRHLEISFSKLHKREHSNPVSKIIIYCQNVLHPTDCPFIFKMIAERTVKSQFFFESIYQMPAMTI